MLMAETPLELQEYADVLSRNINKIGLKINPRKCFSMHLAANPRGCRATTFSVDGVNVLHIVDGEKRKFLGKPV